MSEAMTASIPVVGALATPSELPIAAPLRLIGDPDAAICDGDFCEIPAHHEQAVMNRRVDDDRV